MNTKRLSSISSILIITAAILIAASMFFPWWGMRFYAPQYPEGLNIIVYPNKLEGEIDIVNGLNHYIGMKNFSEDNFPELNFLPYLIGGLALFTLITGLLRSKKMLYILIGLFTVGGMLGVWDLYRWLKDFGTNLNETAPITIEPFIPPLIGENTLANFVTESYLGSGSFIVLAAFILLLCPLWKDRKK
ncbi:hypothetical protein [Bacillus sp. FJAT-47783]|uniref:hypothetical protein n=1 Tax=Bacillus sp. FJAT-47783 TaxID=2922712 RepID=UPI001FAC2604|nr:hypothetical protein [Bacillus sp. FJAT-47783]